MLVAGRRIESHWAVVSLWWAHDVTDISDFFVSVIGALISFHDYGFRGGHKNLSVFDMILLELVRFVTACITFKVITLVTFNNDVVITQNTTSADILLRDEYVLDDPTTEFLFPVLV